MKKQKRTQPYACLELGAVNPNCVTTIPILWSKERPLLRFAGHIYQLIQVRTNKVTTRRVYLMAVDTQYLKLQKIVYSCEIKVKNWQQKALIAAGHTKEDITAAICAARLRGEF